MLELHMGIGRALCGMRTGRLQDLIVTGGGGLIHGRSNNA